MRTSWCANPGPGRSWTGTGGARRWTPPRWRTCCCGSRGWPTTCPRSSASAWTRSSWGRRTPGTAVVPWWSPVRSPGSDRPPPASTPARGGCSARSSSPGARRAGHPVGVAGSPAAIASRVREGWGGRDLLLRQVVAQGVGALRVAQLGHRLTLDLPDPFAGEAEPLADLLQRAGLLPVQAEAHDDHVALAVLERLEDVADVALHHLEGDGVLGDGGVGVLDEVAQPRLLVGTDGLVQAHQVTGVLQQLGDPLRGHVQLEAQLLGG